MKTLKIFLALLFLFLLSTQDGYSWERKKTLKELTNSAPLIVYGKVLEVIPKYEEALLFLSLTGNNCYEIYSISGKLTSKNNDEGKYLNCSLLNEDMEKQ